MKTPSNSINVACVLMIALLSGAAFGTLVAAPTSDGMAIAPKAQDAVSTRPAVPSHPAGEST